MISTFILAMLSIRNIYLRSDKGIFKDSSKFRDADMIFPNVLAVFGFACNGVCPQRVLILTTPSHTKYFITISFVLMSIYSDEYFSLYTATKDSLTILLAANFFNNDG